MNRPWRPAAATTAVGRRSTVIATAMISLSVLAGSACGAAGGSPDSSAPASVSGSGFSGELAQPGTLAVGVAAIYPPYAFLEGGSKTPVGFEIDITNAVAAKLGLKPSYASVEFSSLISGIQSKRFDVATTGIGDTTVREGQVDFVDYEQTYPALLVAKKLEGQIKGLEGMCGRSVAVPKGSSPETLMRGQAKKCQQQGKPELKILLYPDHATAVLAVQSGRADATTSDLPTAIYQAKQLSDTFTFVDTNLTPAPLGFVVSKQNPALRDALLSALKTLYSDGTIKQILTKWGAEKMLLPAPGINLASQK